MTMLANGNQPFATLNELAGKLALELVYAEPGKDSGLLPINSLLSQMEELVPGGSLPAPLVEGLQQGRKAVDKVFDNGGFFDAEALKLLGAWVQWLPAALEAGQSGREISAFTFATESKPTAAPVQPVATAAAAPVPSGEEPSFTLNLGDDAELLREFSNESHEHLQNIEQGVLVLEENPTDLETLNTIFRAFHTFKGGSGFLNLKPINHLAHELESLLDAARQSRLTIDSGVINVILTGGDTLKQFITEIEQQLSGQKPPGPIVVPTLELLGRIRAVLDGTGKSSAVPTPVAPPPAPVISALPSPAAPAPALEKSLLEPKVQISAVPDPASAAKAVAKPASPAESGSKAGSSSGTAVKVDTAKLDGLIDLVGELVIAHSLVAQDETLRDIQSPLLLRNLTQLHRITTELQKTAMSLRMVPIRATFQKMVRLVRDVAAKAGKQAELKMSGEDTELDRTIVEEISDPLIHMIRNSVDHGIEKPEARVAKGKPEQGTVTLRAFHKGGNIVIEIADDGGGLPKDKILAKAVERGLVKPGQQLSDKDIFALIFEPGFSTAEKVTDLSGRGVGMDVVRRNIDKLRGKIDIQSTLGAGSVFTISLPLTLAIIDGMIVGVGNQRFILPALSVRESFRPAAEMISSVHERGEMVNVRGHLSPLLRLYEYFDIPPATTEPTQGIVVVIESDGEDRCILVDHLYGKQEVVIKSLGETFKQIRAVAGAAVLGDGRVGLILDANALVRLKALAAAA